jgi:hypothetical protein
MTIQSAILDLLRSHGPQSRPQIERYLIEGGVSPVLAQLKRDGSVLHVRRGGRHVTSLYAAEDNSYA